MAEKTLLIGLGGFGCMAAEEAACKYLDHNENTAVFGLDTDQVTARLEHIGFIYLSAEALGARLENERPAWINDAQYAHILQMHGQAHTRGAARFCFEAAAAAGAMGPVQNAILRLADEHRVTILLAASLGGAAGSGILVSVSQSLRAFCRQHFINAHIYAYLAAPEVLSLQMMLPPGQAELMRRNAYVAMKEMDALTRQAMGLPGVAMPEDALCSAYTAADGGELPMDQVFFLDAADSRGNLLNATRDQHAAMLAQLMSMHAAIDNIGSFYNQATSNLGAMTHAAGSPLCYGTVGASRLEYPREAIRRYCALRLAHRLLTEDDPDAEKAAKQAVARLSACEPEAEAIHYETSALRGQPFLLDRNTVQDFNQKLLLQMRDMMEATQAPALAWADRLLPPEPFDAEDRGEVLRCLEEYPPLLLRPLLYALENDWLRPALKRGKDLPDTLQAPALSTDLLSLISGKKLAEQLKTAEDVMNARQRSALTVQAYTIVLDRLKRLQSAWDQALLFLPREIDALEREMEQISDRLAENATVRYLLATPQRLKQLCDEIKTQDRRQICAALLRHALSAPHGLSDCAAAAFAAQLTLPSLNIEEAIALEAAQSDTAKGDAEGYALKLVKQLIDRAELRGAHGKEQLLLGFFAVKSPSTLLTAALPSLLMLPYQIQPTIDARVPDTQWLLCRADAGLSLSSLARFEENAESVGSYYRAYANAAGQRPEQPAPDEPAPDEPAAEDAPFIFISYSHKNAGQVMDTVRQLEAWGCLLWYDEAIRPSTRFDDLIAEKIKQCAAFVAFITTDYLQSDYCMDELFYAGNLKKERLLIRMDEQLELPPGMEMRTTRLQYIFPERYATAEEFYQKLKETPFIRKNMQRSAQAE